MADVTCPLSLADYTALFDDAKLPADLHAVLEDPARTHQFTRENQVTFEVDLTANQAKALRVYATNHKMHELAKDLRTQLAVLEGRKRRKRNA